MSSLKVLVVDDERPIQAALKAILGSAGHTVVPALDAVQAPMLARQAKPDLVILDINMPGGGGYTAFERLRMMSTTLGIPVLIYTVTPRAEVVKRIPEAGDVAFLQKPATGEEVLAAVARLAGTP